MNKNVKCIFAASLRKMRKRSRRRTFARIRMRLRSMKQLPKSLLKAFEVAKILDKKVIPKGFDPELLFVECGRCGSPVLWENGRASKLLLQAGIDPLELDSSCMLVTDGCPACSQQNEYMVKIFRVTQNSPALLPPRLGHA